MKLKKLFATVLASASLFSLTGCGKADVVDSLANINVKNATVSTTVKLDFVSDSGTIEHIEEYYIDEYDGYNYHYFYKSFYSGMNNEMVHYGYINPENKNEMCFIADYDDKHDFSCEAKPEDAVSIHNIDNLSSIKDIVENKSFKRNGKTYVLTSAIELRDLVDYLAIELSYDVMYGLEAGFFQLFKCSVKLDSKNRLTLFKIEAASEDGFDKFSYELKISKYGKTKIEIPTE